MFFEKNAAALRQAAHQREGNDLAVETLFFRLTQVFPATESENPALFETPAGDYSLQYREIALHDPAGAMAEARQMLDANCRPGEERVHLLLGLGLGYLVLETFQRSTGTIIVYEPHLPLLRFILENVDLAELLGSPRVLLVTTQEDLLGQIAATIDFADQLDIIATAGYAALLGQSTTEAVEPIEPLQALLASVVQMVEYRANNYRVGAAFHLQWIHQCFENAPYFPQAVPWRDWQAYYGNKPALIISRGPSLDAALPIIRKLQGSMVLIAIGAALKGLHEAEIVPDFAVFLDVIAGEALDGLPVDYTKQIVFLNNLFTSPACYTTPNRAIALFAADSREPMAAWLDMALGNQDKESSHILRLKAGGTVSIFALEAALALQCDPVVLIGQDLAFPNNQFYAGGAPVITNIEGSAVIEGVVPQRMVTVFGQSGETLQTLKAYADFIQEFERIAHSNALAANPTRLINASIGGATIEGYELIPLSLLGDVFPTWDREQTKTGVPYIRASEQVSIQQQSLFRHLGQMDKVIQVLLQDLRSLQILLKTAQSKQGSGASAEISEKMQAWLDTINRHPAISYILMFELVKLRRSYNAMATGAEAIVNNQAAIGQCLKSSQEILIEMLPVVEEAQLSFGG